MSQDQAPRRDYPDDPVTATPDEVAASRDGAERPDADRLGADRPRVDHPDLDLTGKADTTKQASVEPTD
jgi:hypothetical protein